MCLTSVPVAHDHNISVQGNFVNGQHSPAVNNQERLTITLNTSKLYPMPNQKKDGLKDNYYPFNSPFEMDEALWQSLSVYHPMENTRTDTWLNAKARDDKARYWKDEEGYPLWAVRLDIRSDEAGVSRPADLEKGQNFVRHIRETTIKPCASNRDDKNLDRSYGGQRKGSFFVIGPRFVVETKDVERREKARSTNVNGALPPAKRRKTEKTASKPSKSSQPPSPSVSHPSSPSPFASFQPEQTMLNIANQVPMMIPIMPQNFQGSGFPSMLPFDPTMMMFPTAFPFSNVMPFPFAFFPQAFDMAASLGLPQHANFTPAAVSVSLPLTPDSPDISYTPPTPSAAWIPISTPASPPASLAIEIPYTTVVAKETVNVLGDSSGKKELESKTNDLFDERMQTNWSREVDNIPSFATESHISPMETNNLPDNVYSDQAILDDWVSTINNEWVSGSGFTRDIPSAWFSNTDWEI